MAIEQGLMTGRKTVEELAREFEDVVVERLKRVERSNRRLRSLNLILFVALLVVLVPTALLVAALYTRGVPAWATSGVAGSRFVLEGPGGEERGVWEVAEDGAARMTLNDAEGIGRLKMTVLADEGAPGVTLTDESGRSRVVLGYLPDGTSTMVFADGEGIPRAVFGLSGEQGVTLVFADRTGVTRAALGVDPSGGADLALYEDAGLAPISPDSVAAEDAAAEASADTSASSGDQGTRR